MKKMALLATALAMVSGSAIAADMPLKAVKAPPPAAFDPWDIAFGSAVMNDYIFRGVTQSNHMPSVTAYFEPRYNVNKDLQLYIGTSTESISFAPFLFFFALAIVTLLLPPIKVCDHRSNDHSSNP